MNGSPWGEKDMTLHCVQCGQPFVWSADEQKFFMKKGFYEPRRCKPCQEKRRAEMEAKGIVKKT